MRHIPRFFKRHITLLIPFPQSLLLLPEELPIQGYLLDLERCCLQFFGGLLFKEVGVLYFLGLLSSLFYLDVEDCSRAALFGVGAF